MYLNGEKAEEVIRHRDETLDKFRKSKDHDLYKEYCKFTKIVQKETRISKRDYLANTFG